MAGPRVLGIDHVTVTTPEELEDDVVGFYSLVLGLERMDKPPGAGAAGAWFTVGGLEVHVSVDEENPPRRAHFGLVVDDHAGFVERLREAGCHIEQATPIPGRRRFYTRDPAGNRIEILDYDEANAGQD